MMKTLGFLLLGGMLISPGAAPAGDVEAVFNSLTHRQREYVQIRLRVPGFLQSEIDGRFGRHTAEAIQLAAATPGFRQYRMQARSRGLRDEETIALYFVLSDVYTHTVIRH